MSYGTVGYRYTDYGYEPDYGDDSDDYHCCQNSMDKEECKEWLKDILKHAYITGDVNAFENNLEELCHLFDLNLPRMPLRFVIAA